MKETSKLKKIWSKEELRYFQGKGIDIGCGGDPIFENVYKFDLQQGDANEISQFVQNQFDFVYSSHCLEHMNDPQHSMREWWKLVKPGGYLIVIVPDEDLYEQGIFPSTSNPDHKATFTISKRKSWSTHSYNMLDLANSLSKGQIISLQLQDNDYDRTLQSHKRDQVKLNTTINLMLIFCSLLKKYTFCKALNKFLTYVLRYNITVDQTLNERTLAQIQCIVKKTN
jgi:SAM-dependent methyltransferase